MTVISKHISTPNQGNKQVSLLETTGVYSTTNVGGYGALQTPLNRREIADIVSSNYSILTSNGGLTYEGSLTPTIVGEIVSEEYDASEAQSIANQNTVTLDLLDNIDYVDGVYKSIYIIRFEGISTVTTSGIFSTTLVVQDYNEFTNASYIYINDIGDGNAGVAKIISVNNNNTLTLEREVAASSENYAVLYESTSYFTNTYNINKCLHSKIANLAASCGCNDDYVSTLFQAVMLYMSIQPNMDLGKYTQVQETINALTMFCNDGSCNC